ncbi:Zinc finger, FYVE/PHD-type [Sesbania bispinosa]|nr:Zinc finger, FYVE/PHD-type [Sesbania bispinosa]
MHPHSPSATVTPPTNPEPPSPTATSCPTVSNPNFSSFHYPSQSTPFESNLSYQPPSQQHHSLYPPYDQHQPAPIYAPSNPNPPYSAAPSYAGAYLDDGYGSRSDLYGKRRDEVYVQFKEMGGSKRPAESLRTNEQPTEKKKGFVDWMNLIKPANEEKDRWVPNEAVSKCTVCGTDFGAFVRRVDLFLFSSCIFFFLGLAANANHYCRNCGDIFCDKCTHGRIALTADENAQPAEVTNAKESSSKSVSQSHEDLARKLQGIFSYIGEGEEREADMTSLKLMVEAIQAQNAMIMEKLDALNDKRKTEKKVMTQTLTRRRREVFLKMKDRSLRSVVPLSRAKLLNLARAIEREVVGSRGGGYTCRGSSGSSDGFGAQGNRRSGDSDWIHVGRGKDQFNDRRLTKGRFGFGTKEDKTNEFNKMKISTLDKGLKHLSLLELNERRKKGPCYKCGGKYHPLHQCPDKQLKVMLLEDDEVVDGIGDFQNVELGDLSDSDGECSMMLLGNLICHQQDSPQTMKLRGSLKGIPVLILVDSGATHNFVSKRLVSKVGWEAEETKEMKD